MRVKVQRLRKEGQNLHFKEQSKVPPFVGELSIGEERDPELGRGVLRARLFDINSAPRVDLLPELSDVCLLWAAQGKMRLSGFERVETTAYAQTWSVEVQ